MSKIALSSNEAFSPLPGRLAGRNPSSAGRDFHTSVAAVASALHGSHSNELGAGEQAAAVGAATRPLSHPGPFAPALRGTAGIFFRKESAARLGVGVSGSRGSRGVRVSCLPAQLCRRLEGGRRALAAMPKHRRNIAVAVTGDLAAAEFGAFPDAGSSAAGLQKKKNPSRRKALDGGSRERQSAGGLLYVHN